ncbi:MAG: AraC family transcriptional regulator [Bacteroidota bacterium]
MNATPQFKFSDIATGQNILELHVGTCSKPPEHFNVYDEARGDFFSIGLLVNGQVKMKLNLKEKQVSKNGILFLVPNTIKQLISRSDDTSLYHVIFTSKFLLQIGIEQHEIELIDFNSRSNENIVTLTDDEREKLKKIIEDLKEKIDNILDHPFGVEIVKHTFHIFLAEMAAISVKYNVAPKHKTSRKQDIVMQFSNLVNSNFKENRSVKFYADQLAITPKYLTEIVHEVTGKPASVIIDEKVMYEAKVLLNNPRLTIAQIADDLHFSDQSFLGKFFKRHLGLSPSQYRSHKLA